MTAKPKRATPKIVRIGALGARASTDGAGLNRPNGEGVSGARRGTLVAWSEADGLRVDFEGSAEGPMRADCIVALTAEQVEAHIAARTPVILAFDGEGRPVVIGIVHTIARAAARTSARTSAPTGAEEPPGESVTVRARVDGDEVVVEGRERVELRCGKASIVLTRAGKVLIQGTYISSRSSGAHRVRGGSVEIN